MQIHELCAELPVIEGEPFDQLKNDIEAKGLLNPILVYENKIIDGKNRLRALQELNREPTVENGMLKIWEGNGSLKGFIASLNLLRRHLTSSQRAAYAVDYLEDYQKAAKKRQGKRTDLTSDKNLPEVDRSKDKAAKDFSTNRQYLNEAEKIKKEAPEKLESIKSGKKTISQVKQELKKSEKPISRKSSRGKSKFRYCVEYTLAKRYVQSRKTTSDNHEYATKEEALNAGMNKIKKYYVKRKYDGHIWLEIGAKIKLPNGGYTTQKLHSRKYECKNKELAILDEKKSENYISEIKSDIKEMQKKIKVYKDRIKRLSLEHELPAPTEPKKEDYDILKIKRPRPWKGEFIYKYPDDSETKIEASVSIVDMKELLEIAKDRAPKDFDHEKGLISTLRR